MAEDLIRKLEIGYDAQRAGNFAKAEQLYQQVLKAESRNIHALNLLGMLCVNASRPEEAVDYLSRALEQTPNDPQTQSNIGLAYKDMGRAREAIKHFGLSIELDPNNPDVHNNLGNIYRAVDNPKAAVQSYEHALRIHRDFAECWSNLAAALNEAGEYKPAMKAVGRALELNPKLAQAYNNRGDIYLAQARYEDAIDEYRKAVDLDPKYAAALINMAKTQRDMDLPEQAVGTLGLALELEPNNPEGLLVQGVLNEQTGNREGAAESFKAAIESSPTMTVAHYYLAQIKGRESTVDEVEAMHDLWERAELTPNAKMYLAFGLFRACDRREQYDDAYRYLAEGNRIRAESTPYDDEETAEYIESILSFSAGAVARLGDAPGKSDTRPVFILGMPRSGTSLTEQILASHSAVAGAGELSYAYDTVHSIRGMTNEKFPDNMNLLTAEQYAELGDYYMSRHLAGNLDAQYVVDKTPLNFQYIGLLGLALPQAKFIHCHRNPVANCYSIHRMPFDEKQTYAHDLTALGKYYTRYWNLMQRWKTMFSDRILDVRYEDTVADTEKQSRRILDFLDLAFEEKVLEFHKTERLVKTPSASQVRQPIYKDSLEAWKNYEQHLGPLINNLQVDIDA
jgi:tetratricopeptide (TPR) repeat protein